MALFVSEGRQSSSGSGLGKVSNSNKKAAVGVRSARYSLPQQHHYISGLGDGNYRNGNNAKDSFAKGEDDDGVYLLRRRNPMIKTTDKDFSSLFQSKNGLGNELESSEVEAAWQLSAFALLGAVVLLSALFLHVLADSAAEGNGYRQRRQRRITQQLVKKDKIKDDDDAIADDDDFIHIGQSGPDPITLMPSSLAPNKSDSQQLLIHQQQQQQNIPAQTSAVGGMDLYYPYQPRLRKTAGMPSHISNVDKYPYHHPRIYNLNAPISHHPPPSNNNNPNTKLSPVPNNNNIRKPATMASPPSHHRQRSGLPYSSLSTPNTTAPNNNKTNITHKTPPSKIPNDSLGTVSSFESVYNIQDNANLESPSPVISLEPHLDDVSQHLPSERLSSSLHQVNLGISEEDDIDDNDPSFSYVDYVTMENTPRRFNGRRKHATPFWEEGEDSAENNEMVPFLPALSPQPKNNTPAPPRPVPLDELQEMIETGNVPVEWHTPTFEQQQTFSESSSLPMELSSSLHEERPVLIDEQDVSSHNSFPLDDPRRNIDHVRGSLIDSTNSAASLQGAIDFSELQLVEVIGGGGFGQVWRATWRSTPVAVKVLTGSAQSKKVPRAILEEFAAEINLLKGMRHPNICLYMGACLQPPNRAIITELAANGSLWDALRLPLNAPFKPVGRPPLGMTDDEAWPPVMYLPDPRHGMPPVNNSMQNSNSKSLMPTSLLIPSGTWPWSLVKRVACGTARGMAYLHSGNPPVLHRDLKSANILLDESYIPKVCDFGLSRLAQSNASMTGNCGTVQWMAPEVLANQRYNEKADVFSYGIILWELLTRTCPYEGMGAVQCALAVLNKSHRPSIPTWCPPFLHAIIRGCWKTDPRERPTFKQILDALESMP